MSPTRQTRRRIGGPFLASILSLAACLAALPAASQVGAPLLVEDLNPGPGSSSPRWLTSASGRLYFIATTPTTDWWAATAEPDGSAASMIPAGGPMAMADELSALGGSVFFGTYPAGSEPSRLWTGNEAGVSPIAGFVFTPPTGFVAAGGSMYMSSSVGGGAALYVSSGNLVNRVGSLPCDATEDDSGGVGDRIALGVRELHTTGGAGWPTGLHVADGCDSTLLSGTRYQRLAGSNGFAWMTDVMTNLDLVRTDGMAITPLGSIASGIRGIVSLGGVGYVVAGGFSGELWRNVAGSPDLVRLDDGSLGGIATEAKQWAATPSAVYFAAYGGPSSGLWKIGPGGLEHVRFMDSVGEIVAIDDRVFFTGIDSTGSRLWTSDGTSAGTQPVTLPASDPDGLWVLGTGGGTSRALAAVGSTIFFVAEDNVPRGRELWAVSYLGARDTDGDGVPDFEDNCPDTRNRNQSDRDADGVGDRCDNCPHDYNPDQANGDGDRRGDACDRR